MDLREQGESGMSQPYQERIESEPTCMPDWRFQLSVLGFSVTKYR